MAIDNSNLPGYYNDFPARKAKGYKELAFRSGRVISANELNVMQSNLLEQILEVSDGLYDNGDIISGLVAAVVGDAETSNFTISDGKLYIRGRVYQLASSVLTIPVDVRVSVGVRLISTVVTDVDDALLKDPAIGFDNQHQPGAATIKTDLVWGWQADGGETEPDAPENSEFYPIFDVDSGNLIIKDNPPAIQAVIDTVADYDYTSHGNYTVDGFQVRFARFEEDEDRYVFTISNGVVHVRGYQVGRTVDTPLNVPIDFDLATAENESEAYDPDDDDEYTLTLNRIPLATISAINGLVEITETIIKGVAGGLDLLENASSEYIISIIADAVTYQEGRDYVLTDGQVDWSPSGIGAIEPTEGDDYTVKYAVRENLLTNGRGNIVSQNNTSIVLTGLIAHTSETPSIVYVSYSYKLQRVDAITIDIDGTFHRIKGRPSLVNPAAPAIPITHTKLALIVYNWYEEPVVKDIRTPAVSFERMIKMEERIEDLYDLMALNSLRNDLSAREPADRRGQFVDAFLDNDFRDPILSNNMAILEGLLTLPITGDASPPNYYANSLTHHLLPFNNEIIVEQNKRTACSKINPYQSFEPIPARVTINPATDTWVVPSTQWNTPIVSNFLRVDTDAQQNATPATNNLQVANSQDTVVAKKGETIRPQTITFLVEGFGAGEALNEIRFDDIIYSNTIVGARPFTVSGVANAEGEITGSFAVPAGVPTGEKAVEFFGDSSYGDATFVGMSKISYPVIRRVSTRSGRRKKKKKCDPLAETFTLDEDRILTGISLKFCRVGDVSKPVYVQLRETTAGLPNQEIIAEGLFWMDTLTLVAGVPVNVWTDVMFEIPAHAIAGREYAFVIMTDDANHSVATASIGAYMTPDLNDGVAGFITGQPFQGGEMLSSSNASTWTPHPKEDITFRILAARFTTGTSSINLGVFNAVNISDLLMIATVLRPSADCDVLFRFTPTSTPNVYDTREEVPLALPLRLDGDVAVSAILTSNFADNETLSPILYARPQVAKGVMSNTGNYIGRPFNARNLANMTITFKATVVFEYQKKSGVVITPKIQSHVHVSSVPQYTAGPNPQPITEWVNLTLHAERVLEGGWVEAEYRLLVNAYAVAPAYTTRIQLTCSGAPASRVYIRKARAVSKT